MPTAGSPDDLLAAALGARERTYSPYSGYAVGAALRDELVVRGEQQRLGDPGVVHERGETLAVEHHPPRA